MCAIQGIFDEKILFQKRRFTGLVQLAIDCTELNEMNEAEIKQLETLITRELETV